MSHSDDSVFLEQDQVSLDHIYRYVQSISSDLKELKLFARMLSAFVTLDQSAGFVSLPRKPGVDAAAAAWLAWFDVALQRLRARSAVVVWPDFPPIQRSPPPRSYAQLRAAILSGEILDEAEESDVVVIDGGAGESSATRGTPGVSSGTPSVTVGGAGVSSAAQGASSGIKVSSAGMAGVSSGASTVAIQSGPYNMVAGQRVLPVIYERVYPTPAACVSSVMTTAAGKVVHASSVPTFPASGVQSVTATAAGFQYVPPPNTQAPLVQLAGGPMKSEQGVHPSSVQSVHVSPVQSRPGSPIVSRFNEQQSFMSHRSDEQMTQFLQVMQSQVSAQREAVSAQKEAMVEQKRLTLTTGEFEQFDGSDLEFFPIWMAGVRDRVEKNRLEEADGYRHILRCLGGSARALVLKSGVDKTFSAVSAYLENRFTDHYRNRVKAVEFATRVQQPDESVRDFISSLDVLCPVLETSPQYDLLMIMRMCTGLRLEEHRRLASESLSSGKSVREIEGRLMMKETAFHMRGELRSGENKLNNGGGRQQSQSGNRPKSSGGRGSFCTTCNRSANHISSNCPNAKQASSSQSGGNSRCYVCGEVGHRKYDCPKRQHQGQNQQAQGSSASGIRCYNCQNTGHRAAQCPHPRRNNDQNQTGRQGGPQANTGRPQRVRAVTEAGGELEEEPSSTVEGKRVAVVRFGDVSSSAVKNDGQLFTVCGVSLTETECLPDSGSDENLMDPEFAKQLGLTARPCSGNLRAVNGTAIDCGGVVECKVESEDGVVDKAVFHLSDCGGFKALLGKFTLRDMDIGMRGKSGKSYMTFSKKIRGSVALVARVWQQLERQPDDEEAAFLFRDEEGELLVARVMAPPAKESTELWSGRDDAEMLSTEDEDSTVLSELASAVEAGEVKSDRQLFLEGLDIESSAPAEVIEQLKELLWEKRGVFSSNYGQSECQNVQGLGLARGVEHCIETGEHPPFCMRARRLPLSQVAAVEQMIQDLLEQGVIVPSTSPWCSCVVLVRKKDKSWRFCVDFRRLNSITVRDSFPLPRIDALLDSLQGKQVFSALDLKCAYYCIPIRESDQCKTAFMVLDRLFQWRRMPFGLCNAPASFSRLMQDVLREHIGVRAQVYLDDILIFSDDYVSHVVDVGLVLDALAVAGLLANPKKCFFLRSEVQYLGFLVGRDGLRADPAKIRAIVEFPLPDTKEKLQGFFGLVCYLQRFEKDLQAKLHPLRLLMVDVVGQKTKLKWTDETEQYFYKLRAEVSATPVLMLPDPSKEFHLTTDASLEGFGAYIEQEHDGVCLPVAFASKALSRSEKNYSVIELEARGIVFGLDRFRAYLLGAAVIIHTDHRPLSALFKKDSPDPKMQRWCLLLQSYNIVGVEYKKGSSNVVADALSRSPLVGLVAVDSQDRRLELMKFHHSGRFASHAGWLKVYQKLRSFYDIVSWPTMKEDVKQFVSQCNVCRMRSNRYEIVPLCPRAPPSQPRKRWYLDFSPFCVKRDARLPHALLGIDALSKFVVGIASKSADCATAKKLLEQEIIDRYGVPEEICSDAGSHFVGKVFQQALCHYGVVHTVGTAGQKTSSGLVERVIQSIQTICAKKLEDSGRGGRSELWHLVLKDAIRAYNATPHTSLGNLSPFEVFFGSKFSSQAEEVDESPLAAEIWAKVRDSVVESQQANVRRFKSNVATTSFKPGDMVWVKNTRGRSGRKAKCEMVNVDPGVVLEVGRRSAEVQVYRVGAQKLRSGPYAKRSVPLSDLQRRFD